MAPRVLIGCTGSVAAIKIPQLVEALHKLDPKPEVQLVATDHALHFFKAEQVSTSIYTDKDEWETWSVIQDPVLHIELRKWADILLIAPLDANTMAKMAGGLCDNLLTCIVRAWNSNKPLLFAPAMNTHMWNHPLTAEHIGRLKSFGYTEVPCVCKKLACGDTGYGAMAEVSTLVSVIEQTLQYHDSTTGEQASATNISSGSS